ncbi:hypothetical protein [Spiroplasma endosymbiont of Othius punctulatus]|uniref:hypothetical protein n=1 Tax=Spiroplasma endosymbiont of Othius punctulatus TaxID=3066289 RepID=UPI0030CFFE69
MSKCDIAVAKAVKPLLEKLRLQESESEKRFVEMQKQIEFLMKDAKLIESK